MEKLLKGSIRAEACWHAWRCAGATYLRAFGLPWRFLCWWGRWASVKMAHYYATPPDEFDMVDEARLPWPTDTGFTWKRTHLALLWPKSLRDLFDEKPTIKKPSSESRKNARDSSKQVVDSDSEGDAASSCCFGRSQETESPCLGTRGPKSTYNYTTKNHPLCDTRGLVADARWGARALRLWVEGWLVLSPWADKSRTMPPGE